MNDDRHDNMRSGNNESRPGLSCDKRVAFCIGELVQTLLHIFPLQSRGEEVFQERFEDLRLLSAAVYTTKHQKAYFVADKTVII